QNTDGGWGGAKGVSSSIEETATAVDALTRFAPGSGSDFESTLTRGVHWLVGSTHRGCQTPASPLGLYFARLLYFEELYPLIFSIGSLARARGALVSNRRARYHLDKQG